MRPVNSRTRLVRCDIRGKLSDRDARKLRSNPARLDEQSVDIREGLNAPFNSSFKSIRRIRMRKIYGGLDGCQDILGSVLGFPSENSDMLVVPLSLRDVPNDF